MAIAMTAPAKAPTPTFRVGVLSFILPTPFFQPQLPLSGDFEARDSFNNSINRCSISNLCNLVDSNALIDRFKAAA
jgi:hypothetical protein